MSSKHKETDLSIRVLRVGHRFVRDERTLTHLCLASRALGAEAIYLQEVEPDMVRAVQEVNDRWGGNFQLIENASWRSVIQQAKEDHRVVVHLTMYGIPIMDRVFELRKYRRFLLVVGGPKVPGEVYNVSDFNIAITSQPHSETAALAIALHEIQAGEELKRDFGESKLRIIPKERGKRVVRI